MARPAERIPTFEELYLAVQALPEGLTGEILEDGRIDAMGRPGRPHTRTAMRLARALAGVEDDDERDGWVFAAETEVRLLGNRLLVPDLCGWIVRGGENAFLGENPVAVRPDWACEILSPSTERKDRAVKLPIYARAEIPHIWLVDPERRRVEVYQPREGVAVRTLVAEGSAIAALPPFPELELPLASLWGR
jgi:Uma2 family endonuclease